MEEHGEMMTFDEREEQEPAPEKKSTRNIDEREQRIGELFDPNDEEANRLTRDDDPLGF